MWNTQIYTISDKIRPCWNKSDKNDIGGGGPAKNVMLLTGKFLELIFAVTHIMPPW